MNLAYPPGDRSWKFRGGLNWDHDQFEKAKEKSLVEGFSLIKNKFSDTLQSQ